MFATFRGNRNQFRQDLRNVQRFPQRIHDPFQCCERGNFIQQSLLHQRRHGLIDVPKPRRQIAQMVLQLIRQGECERRQLAAAPRMLLMVSITSADSLARSRSRNHS